MERLTRICLEHPRRALAGLAITTLLFGSGLPSVRSEYGYAVLIGSDHPAIVGLDRHVATFGGGAPVKLAWECGPEWPCAHPLDATSLEMAHAVALAAASLNEVQRVYSPSNATLTVPNDSGFAVRRLVEDDRVVDDRAALAERALHDPLWRGVLISTDQRVGVIQIQPRDTGIETSELVLEAMLDLLEPWREAGFDFALAGDNVAGILGGRALDESIARVIPALVVVIALVLAAMTRSWLQSMLCLGTMGIAVLWTFGALGHLDWPQDGILETLAPLVLVVGVCDAVHFVRRASEHEVAGTPRRAALLAATRDIGPACAATTATTGLAFLSFTTSSLDTFLRFGFIASFGVLCCLALTFTLLPLLLERFGDAPSAAHRPIRDWQGAMDAIHRFARRHATAVMIAAVALSGLSVAGASRITADTDWEEMMGGHHPAIEWTQFIAQRVGYSETLEVSIELPDATTLAEPQTLTTIDRLGHAIASDTPFADSRSLVDAMKRVNRALHADDPAYERIADTHDGNAELIEMLAFDDPGLLASWLSIDRTVVRISLGAPIPTHAEERVAVEQASQIARSEVPSDWKVELTGEPVATVAFIGDVMATQVRSFPIALGLVWCVASFYFRSFRLGLATVIPTALPALWTLGSMGWLDMKLDMGRAMVAVVILGVGVDDAIHLLTVYREERAGNCAPKAAMQRALRTTGPALWMTSLALALGFLTLRFAAWATIASFGALVACAILAALGSTLLLIPAGVEIQDRLRRPARCSPTRKTGHFQTVEPSKTELNR